MCLYEKMVKCGEILGKTCEKLAENKQAYLNKKSLYKKMERRHRRLLSEKKMNTYE